MKIIFEQDDLGIKRAIGYATVDYGSNSDKEIVKETSESVLDGLVPDSFEGGWKENKEYFKLEDGEIVFDESYTPPNPTGGN